MKEAFEDIVEEFEYRFPKGNFNLAIAISDALLTGITDIGLEDEKGMIEEVSHLITNYAKTGNWPV